MGKRRIVIEAIKDSDKRYVTFSKRRQGLFKKAETACRMYGSQIGIIVFSPTGKLYSFGPVDSVIDRFLHQSTSSSSYLNNLEAENVVTGTSTTTTTADAHIEDGIKKRSRSGDDNDRVPMMEERENKKGKLLMMSSTTTEAATTTEEGFLLIKSEIKEEEGLMMKNNEFMGFEQNVTKLEEEEVLLVESQIIRGEETEVDYDELDKVLNGFADYIIGHDDEQNMFDLVHQGVYDVDGFTFSDIWPTIDVVHDQLLS